MPNIGNRIDEMRTLARKCAPAIMNGHTPEREDIELLARTLYDVLYWIKERDERAGG
jgi:hypothetical protein